MVYNFKKLKEIVRKYQDNDNLTENEKDVLIALHSIGRDGVSANGEIMYSCSRYKFDEINIKIRSNNLLKEEEKNNALKIALRKYANNINYIINEIIKNTQSSQYKNQLFNQTDFNKNITIGLKILNDFE